MVVKSHFQNPLCYPIVHFSSLCHVVCVYSHLEYFIVRVVRRRRLFGAVLLITFVTTLTRRCGGVWRSGSVTKRGISILVYVLNVTEIPMDAVIEI
jgi:hypothetical protein